MVRWADKRIQNNNKGDTLTFYSSATREVFTTSRLAKLQRVSPTTIRKRLERGWSDDEIITGRKGPVSRVNPRLTPEGPPPHITPPRLKPNFSHAERPKSTTQVLYKRTAEWFAHCREVMARKGSPRLPT